MLGLTTRRGGWSGRGFWRAGVGVGRVGCCGGGSMGEEASVSARVRFLEEGLGSGCGEAWCSSWGSARGDGAAGRDGSIFNGSMVGGV